MTNPVVNVLLLFVFLFYYILRSIVLAFVPFSYRYKDVSKDTVLITGAGSGIGRLTAIRFAKLGCKLVLWDVNREGNEETAQLVREKGARAFTFSCDITDREAVYRTADKVRQDVGNVTILINNAGIVSGKSILDIPDHMVQKTFEVNTISHFWTVKAFLPGMIKDNKGHIVTIASLAGKFGTAKMTDYCASKFAAVGFDESLRMELKAEGKNNIHTTCICPYYISTGMFDGIKTRAPVLEPDYVASRIVDAILTNEEVAIIPSRTRVVLALRSFLPAATQYLLMVASGDTKAMNTFVGRKIGKLNGHQE